MPHPQERYLNLKAYSAPPTPPLEVHICKHALNVALSVDIKAITAPSSRSNHLYEWFKLLFCVLRKHWLLITKYTDDNQGWKKCSPRCWEWVHLLNITIIEHEKHDTGWRNGYTVMPDLSEFTMLNKCVDLKWCNRFDKVCREPRKPKWHCTGNDSAWKARKGEVTCHLHTLHCLSCCNAAAFSF